MPTTVTISEQPVYGLPLTGSLPLYRRLILSYSPFLYFPLEDGGTGVCNDYLNRYQMTVFSATKGLGLVPGATASLNCAAGQYAFGSVILAAPATFTIGVISSVSFMGANNAGVFGCYNSGGQLFYQTSATAINFYQANAQFISGTLVGPYGTVHMLVATYDGTTTRLYSDGVLLNSGVRTAPSSVRGWGVNTYNNTRTAAMSASDAFVLSTVLSAEQIKQLSVAALGR